MENENYRIRYTPLAYEDLDEINTYISTVLLNSQAALNLLGELALNPFVPFKVYPMSRTI